MRNRDELISSLQDQLDRVRSNIIYLMTAEAQKILWGYNDCEFRSDTRSWRNIAAAEIIALAEVFPSELFHFSNRAYCPLCKDGASVLYESGFKVPEGLSRHLIGWGDPHNQCSVFSAALSLARDNWGERFGEKQEEEASITRERRSSETLYRIDPNRSPELIDEGTPFDSTRNVDEIPWVEDRLAALGFKIDVDKNVKSYTNESDISIVYADPRRNGRITFIVYLKPSAQRTSEHRVGAFTLVDHWTNSVGEKYKTRLLETMSEADDFHDLQRD